MMKKKTFLILVSLFTALFLVQCAKRGNPTGGPVDEDPPEIVRIYPDNYSTGFKSREIYIEFNEYVKLKDIQKQLVISPPLPNMPTVTPQGGAAKEVTITINDTLAANTTYTFNFGQSIVDHNEGNPYPFFKYVFSTGTYIDSLTLKGKISDAVALQPDPYVNVLLYPVNELYTDSIIYKEKPLYVFNTLDSLSTFTMENLATGTYKMVALKEEYSDLKFDPSRDKIGFVKDPITLPNDELQEIVMYTPTPDPVVVKATHEGKSRIYIAHEGRADSLQVIPKNKKLFNAYTTTMLTGKDTVQFWYDPPVEQDSLVLETTLKGVVKELVVVIKERYRDSLTVQKTGDFKLSQPVLYTASTPIRGYNEEHIRILDKDSTAVVPQVSLDEFKNILSIDFEQQENDRYIVELLPGAITDFYGETNDTIIHNYTTRGANTYGNILVTVKGVKDHPVIVQVVNKQLEVIDEQSIDKDGYIPFEYLQPGAYYLRVVYDYNANGRYDTGDFLKGRQPEKVLFIPEVKKLLANWDLIETIILE